MIVTRHWLNEWIDITDLSTEKLCEIFNSIGLEVDSISRYEMPQNVVVGYVKEKTKHPDADKLNICQVDVGSEIKQIVCGAKNVDSGQFVAVALEGAKLPNGIKIKKAKLRGVESNGMICSSTELGLPKINDGIMILDESIGELKVGKELSTYPCLNDEIIELELTANRGDCLSIHGVARDLATSLQKEIKEISEETNNDKLLGIGRVLSLQVEDGIKSSYAYKALQINGKISNLLMQLRLGIVDLKAENIVETMINYVTYSTGVLTRAYNFDCYKNDERATLYIKKTKDGFDGVFSQDKLVSIVGFNQHMKCDLQNAKHVIIEAGYVAPEEISILGMEHKDKPKDFHFYNSSRGSEPDLEFGMKYLEHLSTKQKGITMYGGVQKYIKEVEKKVINFEVSDIVKIIGMEVSRNKIVQILKDLGFEVGVTSENIISAQVPPYRHDISNMQDISEEIVRMIGIDNIPSKAYNFDEKSRINSSLNMYKKRYDIRHKSAAVGFFESVHYVFDNREKIEKYGLIPVYKQRDLANPISNELNTLRTTLAIHLIEAVSFNVKNSKNRVSLFEIGKTFDQKRKESTKIAWICSGLEDEPDIKNHGKPKNIDFEGFCTKISHILGKFELTQATPHNKLYSPYEYANISINGKEVGFMARVHVKVQKEHDIPPAYICEVDFDKLDVDMIIAHDYSKQPISSRDLSLLVPKKLPYFEIKNAIDALKISSLVSFVPVDRFESEEFGDSVSLSIKFTFQHRDKTLEDEDINSMMSDILNQLEKKLSLKLR